jgi:PleD family two-component response regulator
MRLDLSRVAAQWWRENFLKYMREQSAPLKPFRGSETILLVEDEAPVRKMTTLLLERLGYQVQKASSGEEALRLARAARSKLTYC